MVEKKQYGLLKEALSSKSNNILIISHRNPDGDAVGASMGLYHVIKKMGVACTVMYPNNFADYYNWIPASNEAIIYCNEKDKARQIFNAANFIIAVDFNDLGRIKELKSEMINSSAKKILIDHHPNPDSFTDEVISDTSVSSSAELVYRTIVDIGHGDTIDLNASICFYTGIMTDTGCFSFNSSNKETFTIVADLLSKGIDKDTIYDKIYNTFSFNRMKLMGYCLANKLVHLPEHRTAYISLTEDELEKYDFKIGDSEGFVNLPLSIENVVFSVLFIQKPDRIKISFRSKGTFPANHMAEKFFHGGGHLNAAGGECYKSMNHTIDQFLKILPQYSSELIKA